MKPHRLKLALLLLGTFAAIICSRTGSAQGASGPKATLKHDLLVPSHGTYLGIWILRKPDEKTVIDAMEAKIGRKFAIGLHYVGWTSAWPDEEMKQDAEAGRIPLVS